MRRMRALAVGAAIAILAGNALAAESSAQEIDELTGLIKSGDWQLIRNNCIACHSAKLITQQSGSASQWLGLIRWMQASQNLWQFDEDTENRIIAYLTKNYPPKTNRRRAPIPPSLMPPAERQGT